MSIVVVGSINMDIVARVQRIPKPGETISGTALNYFPGGKGANQAIAASKAQAQVQMVGALGNDTFAQTLLDFLNANNVDTSMISYSKDTPTGTAIINVDDNGENVIVIIPGANNTLSRTDMQQLTFNSDDVVICQLEIPIPTIVEAFTLGKKAGATNILNPAPMLELPKELLVNTHIMILNEVELSMLTKTEISENSTDDEIVVAINKISNLGFNGTTIVTLGKRGCIAVDPSKNEVIKIPAFETTALDTTGAGDCFAGNFASHLSGSNGSNIKSALEFASAAASICVERAGAGPSMPTADETNQRLNSFSKAV